MGPLSFAEGFARRLAGPASFRFILQPLVAAIAGIRDGVSDAKLGSRPYGIMVLFDSDSRGELLGAGLRRTAIPLVAGVVIDIVVQWMLFQRVLLSAAILVKPRAAGRASLYSCTWLDQSHFAPAVQTRACTWICSRGTLNRENCHGT